MSNVIQLFPSASDEGIEVVFGEDDAQGSVWDPTQGPPRSASVEAAHAASRFKIWMERTRAEKLRWADHDVATLVGNEVIRHELNAGSSFVLTVPDQTAYMVEGLTKTVFLLNERNPKFLAYLWYRYRVNPKEGMARMIAGTLQSLAFKQGWRREPRRHTFYDHKTGILRLSRYNGTVWALDGGALQVEDNGRYVFFADDDRGRDINFDLQVAPHGELIPTLTDLNFAPETPGGMSIEDQKRALTIWIFCTAFPDLMPTKPILLLEGAHGGGKTTAVRRIQRVIHGHVKPTITSAKREDDFAVQLLRSPVCLLDNLDKYIAWMEDQIAAYATGGEWSKRKLYSDDMEVSIKPHAFIAVSSRNPSSFRRPDIADRCIVLRLERRTASAPADVMDQSIEGHIDRLYGEWLFWLNEITARLMRDRIVADVDDMTVNAPVASAHRMADFARMAYIVGDVLGWTKADVARVLDALQREREAFAGESDPLPDLLDRWLTSPSNNGRTVTADDLMAALNTIATAINRPLIRSSTSLAGRLKSPHIDALYEVRMTSRGSTKLFSIRRKEA